ncbi:MAG TPA: T9SS type A sorting domain-containing protein, partial [Puia sp.]|nr:T9SS type A sorting domain-containing protein [Puia sp.]
SSKKCSSTQTLSSGAVGGGSTEETPTPALQTIDPVATVYPNPAKGLVTIQIKDGTLSADNIQLLDTYGKMYPANAKILSAQSLQIDLSRLSSGMYFIRVKVGDAYQVFRVVRL